MLTSEQISKQASQVREHENMALAKRSKYTILQTVKNDASFRRVTTWKNFLKLK